MAAAAKARAEAERKAREAAAAHAAAQEKRRLEIEELRKQGKWKTHEDVEWEQQEVEEAERRRQQGVFGKLKDLVGSRSWIRAHGLETIRYACAAPAVVANIREARRTATKGGGGSTGGT